MTLRELIVLLQEEVDGDLSDMLDKPVVFATGVCSDAYELLSVYESSDKTKTWIDIG